MPCTFVPLRTTAKCDTNAYDRSNRNVKDRFIGVLKDNTQEEDIDKYTGGGYNKFKWAFASKTYIRLYPPVFFVYHHLHPANILYLTLS